jgi:L-ascorbate metabolism protein UlaG (beta-lactamase superfamily)
MPPAIPEGATFRLAEGLELRVRPCAPERVHVTARRHGHTRTLDLDREDAILLGRLGDWRSAAEVDAPLDKLLRLSTDGLLFWSEGRPTRALTIRPLDGRGGPVALRRNVWTDLLIHLPDEGVVPVPFMPRRRALDGGRLAGVRLTTYEMDQPVQAVSLACCPRHAALIRDILPHLDGRHDLAELAAAGDDARQIVTLFDHLGLLEPHAAPPTWDKTPQVTWLGHAAVLVEAGGRRIAVDPLFAQASIPARPHEDVAPDWRDLGPLDAVLITHADNDHLSPQSLVRIARSTPVFVARPKTVMAYQVDAEAILALLGFERVTALADWERADLGGVTVTAAPFRGEDWGLELVSCTWLVAAREGTAFFGADSAFMPDVYDRIAAEHTVDLAFLGMSDTEEAHVMPPDFGYGNFYEPWIPEEKRNQWLRLCSSPDEAAQAAMRLRARRAFGYAAGGVSYMPMAYSDRGTHAQMAARLGARGAATRPIALPLGRPVPLKEHG